MGYCRWRHRVFVLALTLALLTVSLDGLIHPQTVAAAGEPSILVITNPGSSNPLSGYVTEILAAEGFDDIEIHPLTNLNNALLTGRSVVILTESAPTAAQVTALDNYVTAGGGLIAMRPSAAVSAILGVTSAGGSTSEGYMRITDSAVGGGLYSDTMQFHGAASHYTAQAGTTQIAELYTNRTASAGRPAVTLANRGAGRAAMFAYDLGRSVALTRQGNPANANTDQDGDGIFRTVDLFRNWADMERAAVPQADVQGRLFARLIEAVSPQPMPRLWFFPGTAPTVLIPTGDAHGSPDSYYQSQINLLQPHGLPLTFYMPPAGSPTQANVASWQSQGYDFSIHPYVDCGYTCGVDNNMSWFQSRFGFTPRTSRTHQVRWAGWTDAASIQASRGLQMDLNFYQWGSWVVNSNGPAMGYMNGGGLPMRFVDANGNVLPIYQQHTSLVDEFIAPNLGMFGLSLSQAVALSVATINDAIDNYHVPIATQFHTDQFYPSNSDWAILSSNHAVSRGAVALTADDWLDFVLGRAATAFSSSSWVGNTLNFTASAGGSGQTMLLPLQHRGNSLSGITRGGSSVSYTTLNMNGTAYAAVPLSSGTYAASYAADSTAPTVSAVAPADAATGVPVTTTVSVTFSEAMQQAATQAAFSINPSVTGTFSWNSTGTVMTFTPSAVLAASTTYTLGISTAATDLAGNALATAVVSSFTTAAVTPPPAVSTVSPISGPIAGGTQVTITGTNLTGATAVRFGTVNAASFTVVNDTTITATTPANPAGTVHITVTTPAGTSATVPADQFTFVDGSSAIAVTSVDPGVVPATGGTQVIITGSGFQSGATVSVGGIAATSVSVVNTTRISAVVPASSIGVKNVVVTNTGGGSATLVGGLTYVDCSALCLTQTTGADFTSGATGTGYAVSESADGEIGLAPAAAAEFGGSQLPSGWVASPWTAGGGVTVGGGSASIDAALLGTNVLFTPGRSLEFVATFQPAPHQHIGFGTDLNSTPWAIFSTGTSGSGLFARTSGSSSIDTPISGSWLGSPHRYRIEWTGTSVIYSIDGTVVATHNISINSQLRPVASDGPLGGAALSIDWILLSPFNTTGEYTSRVIDSGGNASWQAVNWTANTPTGTTLQIAVRAGNTPLPDGNWSAFVPLSSSGSAPGITGRYLQYRVALSTTNPNATPLLRDITIAYSVDGTLAPAISGIAPSSGPVSGGTNVTINGANFEQGTTVTFGGTAATNVVVTPTSITATTPARAAGAVNVVVTNPNGQFGTLANGFTYIAGQPAITSIAPNAGPTSGGTVVTISGTNFTDATAVSFGTAPAASYTVVNATTIQATSPAQAEGMVDIRVTTAGGTSPVVTADRFTYIALPPSAVITAVDPGTGPTTGGQTVEITGANFAAGMTVTFGGSPATSLVIVSSATVTATVPAGSAGAVNVTVTNAAGQQSTLVGGYTYVDCTSACVSDTTFANFSSGQPGGSARVTAIADGEVTLAPTAGSDFQTPTLPAGWGSANWTSGGSYSISNGQVRVDSAVVATNATFSPGRTLEFEATFTSGQFQHVGMSVDLNGAPWLLFSTNTSTNALYARSNSTLPGTDTLIPGNWLGSPHRYRIDWTSTTATYSIDGNVVAQHSISSPGDMRPLISDGVLGGPVLSVDWMRVTPFATGSSFESRILDAGSSATWGQIGWSADVPAGTNLTMLVRVGETPVPDATWSAFAPVTSSGTSLDLDGRYLQYRVDLSTSNVAVTPALRDVTISYGVTTGPSAPVITTISPNTGPVAGGTAVTITGSGLSGATAVTFDGVAATFTVVSDGQLQATTPPGEAGSADVVVTSAAGASAPLTFIYTAPPPPTTLTLTGVSPNSGTTAGGTTITLTGTGFVAGAQVIVGGVAATGEAVVNGTTMTAVTGPRSAGAVNVQVVNPNNATATLAAAYTYVAPPTVTAVSPSSGPTAGGTTVTITGTGFISGATVTFAGLPGTNVAFVSATTIRATTPPRSAGAVAVVVTNPNGMSASRSNGFTYSAPTTAPAAGPASVTIQNGSTQSGSASSLSSNNSSYLRVASASQGGTRIVSFYGQYVVPTARRNMVGLTIAYDGGSTASGFNRTISLYNFQSGSWQVLATETQTTADKLTTIAVPGDVLRFMSSSGQIRMRIQASRNGTFTLNADMMTFTVTYQP